MNLFRPVSVVLLCVGSLFSAAWDSDPLTIPKTPAVTVAPPAPVKVAPGKSARIELAFRVDRGFHINSNHPKNASLVPTTLRFSPPTDILVGKVSYPPGQDLQFEFMPDEKLNVYSGDFSISARVSASHAIAKGTYRVRGALKYQACDNRQCYQPREVPLDFDVVVTKARERRVRGNPGQSPHIHN
jgi:hypothetical protein